MGSWKMSSLTVSLSRLRYQSKQLKVWLPSHPSVPLCYTGEEPWLCNMLPMVSPSSLFIALLIAPASHLALEISSTLLPDLPQNNWAREPLLLTASIAFQFSWARPFWRLFWLCLSAPGPTLLHPRQCLLSSRACPAQTDSWFLSSLPH